MPDSDDKKTIALDGAEKPRSVTRSPGKARVRSHNALPLGTRLCEFEIVDLVGEGGFGIVYLAEDHSLKRRVALKEYMPSSLAERGVDSSVVVRSERHQDTFDVGRRSFVNEALLLAQFDHQALVKVFRFWEANGTAYMAMPFYAGKTLREVLKERLTRPDEQWIRKLLLPIMEALELIHAENCFHRDVAPDNIMIQRDERPVLLDFGAARRVISDMTQALTVILKPGFAPIEQYADMPGIKQGPWTDIYALAAVVYFIVVGRSPPASVNRIMQDSYEPLTVVAAGAYSDRLLRGIDQCLAVRAADRPQSIGEMRGLLGFGSELAPTWMEIPLETRVIGPAESPPPDDATKPDPQPLATAAVVPTLVSSSAALPPLPSAAHLPEPLHPAPALASRRALQFGGAHYIGAALGAGLLVAGWVLTVGSPPRTPTASDQPATPVHAPATADAAAPGSMRPPASTLEQALSAIATSSDSSFELSIDNLQTPLTIGRDALSFSLRSRRHGYLYLLLLDTATARLSLLFPNALDADNRVIADQPIVFPRPAWAYQADPPAGNWQLLAIVSAAPRSFPLLHAEILDGVASTPAALIETRLKQAGAGGAALLGAPECTAGEACSSSYAAVRFSVEEAAADSRRQASAARVTATGKTKQDADETSVRRTTAPDLGQQLDAMLKAR